MEALMAAGRELTAMGRAAFHKWSGALNGLNFSWLNPQNPLPGRPIILLHGAHGDPSNWIDLLRKMEAAGPPAGGIYLLKFPDLNP
ncbi:MAG: hypothetical protein AB7F31_02465 [Parachlamydiales bacterium]